MFITFEGIEGCGKSSVLRAVAHRLSESKRQTVTTREPGGSALGELVREMFLNRSVSVEPLAEAFLANASRAQLVETVIRPALAERAIVLCDRYTDSTIAYQGYGRGLDPEMLVEMCTIATGGLTPDFTLLLDVPVEVSHRRVQMRFDKTGGEIDRMEGESAVFHARVRAGYLKLAERFPRFILLNGCEPPENLFERAMHEVTLRTPIA
ncbi:MAG: dTMP kinase [Candidatus Eremiobacteraeota bacterium]|nr:dTMP kinase [Candidatus Eremiobacteraeota bacterium]